MSATEVNLFSALTQGDPRRVGRYALVYRIGSGGFGTVYLARHVDTGMIAAVKIMHPESAAPKDAAEDHHVRLARFTREVEVLRGLRHSAVPQFLESGPEPRPWFATRYVAGHTLTSVLRRHGRLAPVAVAVLGQQVAELLAHVHTSARTAHRDLKTSNVIIALQGPFVVDFGIAHVAGVESLTGTGLISGTPGWLPPERWLSAPTSGTVRAGDVWQLGVLLGVAATGAEAADFSEDGQRPPLTELPTELRVVIERCLDRDPHRRNMAAAVAEDLAVLCGRRRFADCLQPEVRRELAQAERIAAGLAAARTPGPANGVEAPQSAARSRTRTSRPGGVTAPEPRPETRPARRSADGDSGDSHPIIMASAATAVGGIGVPDRRITVHGVVRSIAGSEYGIVVVTDSSNVHLIDPRRSAIIWTVRMPDDVAGAPVARQDRLLIATRGGLIHSYQLRDGEPILTRCWAGGEVSQVAPDGRLLLAAGANGVLSCYQAESGFLQWEEPISAPIVALAAGSGRTILGCADGQVRAVSSADGRELWSAPLGARVLALATDPAVAHVTDANGGIHRLDAGTGARRAWMPGQGVQRWATGIDPYTGDTLAVSVDGVLTGLREGSTKLDVIHQLPGAVARALTITDELVAAATTDGAWSILALRSRRPILQGRLGSGVYGPLVLTPDGLLVAGCLDGAVVALQLPLMVRQHLRAPARVGGPP